MPIWDQVQDWTGRPPPATGSYADFLSGGEGANGGVSPNGQRTGPPMFQDPNLDRTNPGFAEQRAAAGPGGGQQFVSNLQSQYGGMIGGANPTAHAYQQFQQNRPDIRQDAGLDPYYQNAQRRALEGINQNAASRGAYGSSAALAGGQEAITNLAAEQANREADYHLRRMGEQRGWESLAGQLAGQQSASQLGWAQGLGGLGLAGEQLGANIDATGQQAREGRLQNMFNNMFQREALYAPLIAGYQGDTITQDIDLLGGAAGGNNAATFEGSSQQGGRNEQTAQGAGQVLQLIGL